MLNTKMVEGLIGIPKYPINPAVTSKGSRLGIKETKIIRRERNIHPINKEIKRIAKDKEIVKGLKAENELLYRQLWYF